MNYDNNDILIAINHFYVPITIIATHASQHIRTDNHARHITYI